MTSSSSSAFPTSSAGPNDVESDASTSRQVNPGPVLSAVSFSPLATTPGLPTATVGTGFPPHGDAGETETESATPRAPFAQVPEPGDSRSPPNDAFAFGASTRREKSGKRAVGDAARKPDYFGRRKKRGNEICQILIRQGDVSPDAVRKGLALQEERGGQIGRILVAMGACTEEALSRALLEQLRLRDDPEANLSLAARQNPALAGLKVRCRPMLTTTTLLAADLLALAASVCIVITAYWARASATGYEGVYLLLPQALLTFAWLVGAGRYAQMAGSVPDELRASTGACTVSFLGVGGVAVFGDQASRMWTLVCLSLLWLASAAALPLARAITRQAVGRARWWGHPVVVLGAAKTGRLIVRTLQSKPELGLKPVMMLDDDTTKQGTLRASFSNEVVEVRSQSVSAHELLSAATLLAARAMTPDNPVPVSPIPTALEVANHAVRARGMFAEVEGVPVVGDLSLAPVLAARLGIGYAIVAMPGLEAEALVRLVERVGGVFSHLLIVPDLFGFGGMGVSSKDVGGVLGLEVRQQLLLPGPRMAKRTMDFALTALGLIGISPLLLLIALAVKLDSKGSVIYRQKRLGRNGKNFMASKFRTMHGDGEERLRAVLEADPQMKSEYDQFHKLTNDPRVTRVGRILRKYSLDELPQLWNVLRGEMSLVGPRPYLEREIQDMDRKEAVILRTVPGLTGIWQVSDRNTSTFADRVKMDVYYVRNWSPWIDIYVLARTVGVVLRGTGV